MSPASAHRAGPTRIDLHLHTRASTDSGSWFVSRAAMPESHTEPAMAHATARSRGMDLVCVTDHNTISGALEIAHHPDVLIGVEVTTRFPEDGVPLHVLMWGVDERSWADLDRLRANVYELIAHAESVDLPFALAHPLHRVGDVLRAEHLERCLLMFPLWEGINGSRPRSGNEIASRIARSAHPDLLVRLAEKHAMPAPVDGPPALVGGSDDHGSFDIACAWTEMPAATTPAQALDHLRGRRVTAGGGHGSAEALAHSVGALATAGLIEHGLLDPPAPMRRVLGDVLQRPIASTPRRSGPGGAPSASVAARAMGALRRDRRLVRRYRRLSRAPEGRGRSHARVRLATGWIHADMLRRVLGEGGPGARAEAAVGALLAAAPYLLASRYVAGEEAFAHDIQREFFGPRPGGDTPVRAVMLSDTFSQINGVAGTMRRLAEHVGTDRERPLRVMTCEGVGSSEAGRIDLRPVARLAVPGYPDRDLRLGVPSMIDVLDEVRAAGPGLVHAATPGPMGLAGLAAARALGIPFVATYHTEFARYAGEITGDRLAAQLVDRAVTWFYSQAERIYVPSQTVARGLVRDGIAPERIALFGRGIDRSRFGPERGGRRMRARLGARPERTLVLYVGRISREKGTGVLAEAMRRACEGRDDIELCVVGDGPGRAELAADLKGVPHRFTGTLCGDDLAAAYACADVFLFPSATETYGQVVPEAAASGLPTIVSDAGAAHEHVDDGVSGLVVRAGDARGFAGALIRLVDDERLRHRLGLAALERSRSAPSWGEVFSGLIDGYRDFAWAPAVDPGRSGVAA